MLKVRPLLNQAFCFLSFPTAPKNVLSMSEQLTPSDKFLSLLEPCSEEFWWFVTPEVQVMALPASAKEVHILNIVCAGGEQRYKSEALHKLGQLADITQCRVVTSVDLSEVSWYGQHGFVWFRGNSKDVLVRRPQVSTP